MYRDHPCNDQGYGHHHDQVHTCLVCYVSEFIVFALAAVGSHLCMSEHSEAF